MPRTASHRLQLTMILMLTMFGMPIGASAADNVITANGCTIVPLKPQNPDGGVAAQATMRCETAIEGRVVVTELWQRHGDNWREVPRASATFEVFEQLDDDD